MNYAYCFFPSVLVLRFTMKATRTIVILLVMTRVALNTKQLSCTNGRIFIATEGKALPESVVREVVRKEECGARRG